MFVLLEHFYFVDCSAYPFLKDGIFTTGPDGLLMVRADRYPQFYELKKFFAP